MRYIDRILIGLLLVFAAFIVLWFGSPQRQATLAPNQLYSYGFVLLFAVGFIVGSMGLLGAEDDYAAFVSGFVLYFMVGALVAVLLYVRGTGIGPWTLADADSSAFWSHWSRIAAAWPLEVVRMTRMMGYAPLR